MGRSLVRDLRADDNALSFWEVSDDQSNLLDIIAAFVSVSNGIKDDFDYALLSATYFNEISVIPLRKPFITAYTKFNDYHHDVPNLSIDQVVYFAYLLSRRGKFDRMGWKDIENRLKEAHIRKQLDLTQMKKGLKRQLGIQG